MCDNNRDKDLELVVAGTTSEESAKPESEGADPNPTDPVCTEPENDSEDEGEEEETSWGRFQNKCAVGIMVVLIAFFAIFIGWIIWNLGHDSGVKDGRLSKDVVIAAIEDAFTEQEAEYLIRKIEAYKCHVTDYSIYGSADIEIETGNVFIKTDKWGDEYEVKEVIEIEFDYNHFDDEWRVEDYYWPNKACCLCGCDLCICAG